MIKRNKKTPTHSETFDSRKYLRTLWALLVLFALVFAQSVFANQQSLRLKTGDVDISLYSASYALLVGVSNYQNWPDLPGVSKDILIVKEALEKQGFTVKMLADPTRAQFDEAIRDFISKYGQDRDNRLLFYFAGHGYTHTTAWGDKQGYIIPADTPLPKDDIGKLKKIAVGMENFQSYAKQMEAKHALFMFDSCFSGSLFTATRAVPPSISVKTSKPVRQFITAGAADQEVPDESVFRKQFIAGLNGAADLNGDSYITGSEIANFLEETVVNYTNNAQTPQYGKIRDPYLDKGDFVFFKSDGAIPIKNDSAKDNKKAMQDELSYWTKIKNTNKAGNFLTYLERYPNGQFAGIARVKAKQLNPYDTSGSVRPLDKKILVAAWKDEEKTNRGLIRREKTLLGMLKDPLTNFVSDSGDLIIINSAEQSRELVYGVSKNNSAPQEYCSKQSVDLLLTGWLTQSSDGSPVYKMSYYDCKSRKSFTKVYQLDKNTKQEQMDLMIGELTNDFMSQYVINLYVNVNVQPVVAAPAAPDAASQNRSKPETRIVPRW